ncbi:SDR family oxidoreductase [Sneathiella chungangensis]|uniref:Peroxisomal trans-2-enoyl-CoA reductase n=1 Tax=Sneathiella chungangensis TaxID=1418234 RepID=A0A845MIE1_9PROT|nr:SDR family oxidoreductase [Sneathiella chungangensis]MZR23579.1 SDR family oxidoreductase [Sneathiella chungangensis]
MSYRSIFRPGLFDGQSIVVTGGGSGIGRCTAHELISLGARVALVGRSLEKLETVQREIDEAGGSATIHTCDIRDEDAVKQTVADIVAQHGAIHGLVNNAGGQFPALLEEISLKGWDAVIKTNLTGGFLFARECYVQWMKENGGGPIVNMIADMWNSMPGMGHSGAARKGMLSFTETAALEWAPAGVRVNAIAPGMIVSSGMDTYPDWWKARVKARIASHPVKRMGTESEISAGIVFLLSEAAAFITGSCLRVDGGAPNIRMNWDMPDHKNNKAFNGFHLAEIPKFLQEDGE